MFAPACSMTRNAGSSAYESRGQDDRYTVSGDAILSGVIEAAVVDDVDTRGERRVAIHIDVAIDGHHRRIA